METEEAVKLAETCVATREAMGKQDVYLPTETVRALLKAATKYGEWQTISYPDEEEGKHFTMEFFVCSVCGEKVFWNFEKTPYCKRCGAHMVNGR